MRSKTLTRWKQVSISLAAVIISVPTCTVLADVPRGNCPSVPLSPQDQVPSALIGRLVPRTELPPVEGLERDGKPVPGIDGNVFFGSVTILNFWASWCGASVLEFPLLMKLADDKRIRVIGIDYKDKADSARRFLHRSGNPFASIGADLYGRSTAEWKLSRFPSTFVIGRDGRMLFDLIETISPLNLDRVLKPEIEKALKMESSPRR